jgi:hypothetical protein
VKYPSWTSGVLCGVVPGFAEISDELTMPVKDIRAFLNTFRLSLMDK